MESFHPDPAPDQLTAQIPDLIPDLIPELALYWHRAGRGAVMVIVVRGWSSAPRGAGSMMLVAADGTREGTFGIAAIDADLVLAAQQALAEGLARIEEFHIRDAQAAAAGLGCGGSIQLLFLPVGTALPLALLQELIRARAARVPLALVYHTDGGLELVSPGDAPEIDARFRADRSGEDGAGRVVIIFNPSLRLIVVGAVQITRLLAPMARSCGYDLILIDPREAFARHARFPGETIIEEDAVHAMVGPLVPDARTAVVALSHDPGIDDPALRIALASPAFYIGCLGSRRSHAARLERLAAGNLAGADNLARLKGPVGLAIGASTPAEIAVSILAQMTAALRGAPELVASARD